MKSSPAILVATVCAVVFSGPSFSQQKSDVEALEQRFKQLDKNGDGKITTEELPMSQFFQQRDKNGDGVITLAEAKAALQESSPPQGVDEIGRASCRERA